MLGHDLCIRRRRVSSSLPIQGVQLELLNHWTVPQGALCDQYLSPAPTPPALAFPGTTPAALVPCPSAVAEAVYGSPLTMLTCVVLEVTVVPGGAW
jgi:hypothetical protein